jgi:hypothetical protein
MTERVMNERAHRGHSSNVVIDPSQHANHMRAQLRIRTILRGVTEI